MNDTQGWRDDGDLEITFYSTTNVLSLAHWQISPDKAFSK
jgi:hypothetical protein